MYRKQPLKPDTTGQTQLDFTIGIGLFLVSFTIVLSGTSVLLQPFTSGQQNIATADRVADKLTNTHLTTGDRQYVLDKECTVTFFSTMQNNSELTPPDDCRFGQYDANTTLNEVFGVPSTYYINITIEDENGVVTMNGTQLEVGTLPDSGTITLSQRTVRIEDETYFAYVRVGR